MSNIIGDFRSGTIFSIAGTDGYVVTQRTPSHVAFSCPDGADDEMNFYELEQYLDAGIIQVTGRTRESLEQSFRSALNYSYEANMGDYSIGSINRAKAGVQETREAIEAAGGKIDGDHNITWPTEKMSAEEFVAQKFPGTKPLDTSMRAIALEVITEFLATQEA